ncbi:hypothetical protein [Duganella qianjiadongensis]|uniref:Uncharacterized protein n=1 Tax=Duganella qianjiadongensis TaxID=2692176 RepID=A0ABW9VN78_9BURK|nr:hypothetical protein [Duganella qianjiadongensis]MYM41039.1 hypothetical protein [Duganella qianjiadongensis]
MITVRKILSLASLIPLLATGTPLTLHKDMPFSAARKLLIQQKWKPIHVHADDHYSLMGVEHELAKLNIREFDSCSIDYSNCIMRYKRDDQCLTVYTIGEKVKYMKVVDWTNECPESQQSADAPSRR